MTDTPQKTVGAGWLALPPKPLNEAAETAARARQNSLTKPPGALGELEEVAIRLAAMQGVERPRADSVWISVFAGDHGVTEEGVSAFPQAVTAEMVKNFVRGGAAISVAARELGARLEVVNLGTAFPTDHAPGVLELKIGPGTANLAREAAMTADQLRRALEAGRDSVQRALAHGAQVFIGGEMGIGNTTAATAMACALLGEAPEALAGPGTGLDGAGLRRKVGVLRRALELHGPALAEPLEVSAPLEILRRLGGFEIAALAGAYVACSQSGLPALVDGFIASSAALAAERIRPGARRWLLFGHASAEPGHRKMLQALNARPLLDLGLRLGEGSGAAAAVPLIRMACALHGGMATFAEAEVSEKVL